MKRRTVLIVATIAVLAALAATTAIVGAAMQPVVQATDPGAAASAGDVEPDRLTPGTGFPGVYAARDWRKLDPAVFPAVGGHETFTWKEIETSEGVFDWSRIDGFIINQTERGKKTALGITTYNGRIEGGIVVPDWLTANYPQAIVNCSGYKIPRYWSNDYQTKYASFVSALANHLGTNPNVAYVQIGVGLYGETQPSDDSDDGCVRAAMSADGYADTYAQTALWINSVNGFTDHYVSAFGGRQRLMLVYTPTFLNVCEKSEITQYAASKGVGLFAGGFYADTMTVLSNPPGGNGCQKWDPILNWNTSVTKTIPVALESYHYMLPTTTEFYWGVLGTLNKHADYLSLESDLFINNGNVGDPITANLDIMRMANRYLGKTAATAPNAWVALRDTSPATNGHGCNKTFFYPQYGDYDYWLYRDDTVAGGRTITVSNIANYTIADAGCGTVGNVVANPQHDPKLPDAGMQGMITRRTDHASGNDNMYFRVDDNFLTAQGIASSVAITVTYLDTGTDNWLLYYKNAAGTEMNRSVTKTNSGQWRTANFTITNIDFSGKYANANDFRVYNGGAGDEYIHMVSVGRYGAYVAPKAVVTMPIIFAEY